MSDIPEQSTVDQAVIYPDQGELIPRPIDYELPTRNPDAPKSAREAVQKASAVEKAKSVDASARNAVDQARQKLAEREKESPTGTKSEAVARRSDDIAKALAKVKADAQAETLAKKPHASAPSRFSEDAKAAWHGVPENVQGEVHRAVRELEGGIERYRAGNQSWESVREFDEVARQNGGNLRASLEKVVQIEQAFARDPIDGFHRVCQHFGINMHSLATHIAGMHPEQFHAYQQQSQVEALQQQMWQMQQHTAQVVHGFHQAHVGREVADFAKSHPRVDELATEIAAELRAGYDLETAYDRAVKLAGPAKAGARDASGRSINPAGQKQISGAPASGSSSSASGKKGRNSLSTSEAIKRALAQHR